jgi:hypothetical protein
MVAAIMVGGAVIMDAADIAVGANGVEAAGSMVAASVANANFTVAVSSVEGMVEASVGAAVMDSAAAMVVARRMAVDRVAEAAEATTVVVAEAAIAEVEAAETAVAEGDPTAVDIDSCCTFECSADTAGNQNCRPFSLRPANSIRVFHDYIYLPAACAL